MMDKIIPFIK